eukprot:COSAG01_NODE_246_length_20450_cov_195.166822_8_plen_37_part_00
MALVWHLFGSGEILATGMAGWKALSCGGYGWGWAKV